MKTPHSTYYRFTAETIAEANKLTPGTIAERDHKGGLQQGEPLIVAMDALLKYAQAYRERFEGPLAEDYVLGPEWLEAVKGIRGLLNGNGASALASGHSADSKDNGCVESVFWSALRAAGYTEETANL